MLNAKQLADNNLEELSRNSYPGRGIILGVDDSGQNLIQVYWIMGRSKSSRDRVFVRKSRGIVSTDGLGPVRPEEAPFIIYNAMVEDPDMGKYVVSNGEQTNSVYQSSFTGINGLVDGLYNYKYESDKPNNTPRITGVSYTKGSVVADLAILRKSPYDNSCQRTFHRYEVIPPGFGYYVSTYLGNGDPLPSWEGDPKVMPLIGTAEDIADLYWEALDVDNKVSLVVKSIPISKLGESRSSKIVIRNKYQKTV